MQNVYFFVTEIWVNKFARKFWQDTQKRGKMDSFSRDEDLVIILLSKKKKEKKKY